MIIGIIYFRPISKNVAKILFLKNILPLIFKNHPAIMHKINALKGIKTFEVIKSRKSNNVFLHIVKFPNTPKDSVAGIASIDIIKNTKKQAFPRDIFNLSINDAIGTSIMLIPEVIAAAKRSIKNKTDIILPCGIIENIYGKVTNTSPAPELGSKPNENIAGNIIIPAISANKVSENIIV